MNIVAIIGVAFDFLRFAWWGGEYNGKMGLGDAVTFSVAQIHSAVMKVVGVVRVILVWLITIVVLFQCIAVTLCVEAEKRAMIGVVF